MPNIEAGAYLISDLRAFMAAYADDTGGVFLYDGRGVESTAQA